jgi:hypothetical protein
VALALRPFTMRRNNSRVIAGVKRSTFMTLQKPIPACSVLPEQNHTLKLKDHEP